jgi:predicted permease
MSVGATRPRLIRQLLTESVLLACLGGALGALFAVWGKDLLLRWGPWSIQASQVSAEIDARVLGFAMGVSVLTGILFGVVPATRGVRGGAEATTMRTSGRATSERSRLGKSLVVAQIAMSLVLLVGAGFFVQTLWNLKRIDAGFDTSSLLLFRIDPALNRYEPAQFVNNVEQIIDRLEQVNGLQAVTVAERTLVATGGSFGSRGGRSNIMAALPGAVRSNFFDVMGVPVVSGRAFTSQDRAGAGRVAIVNETFARRFFPEVDPVGQQVWDLTIVGVVRDTKVRSLRDDVPPAVFTAYTQELPGIMTFQARFESAPDAFIPTIREIVRQVDPNLAVFDFTTLDAQIDRTQLSQERLFANFASAFGAVALFLVCVGLFGTMSYNVARRTHEIGIRMAVGARSSNVRAMVMREALWLVLGGVATGLAGAVVLTRWIESMLFEVRSNDLLTFTIAIAVLALVALCASYLPARRASKVDPIAALRHE